MFKKSLIAVAVLGATAFSVQAADVTMYGKVDLGLQYKTSEVTVGDKTMVDEDTFSMEKVATPPPASASAARKTSATA